MCTMKVSKKVCSKIKETIINSTLIIMYQE